ncbi:MAG: CDP-alcohol phosphatidyltransferase family protein [Asgard group archaeon]|nr:CDP-alcohol phosphatidyltransferase family protein [Asgard group archaeon]
MVSSKIKHVFIKILKPIIAFFGKLGIHPNVYTYIGLLMSIAAGVLIAIEDFLPSFYHAFIPAVVLIALGAIMDFLDGNVARYQGIASKRGGFLDSILDRIGDLAILAGIVIGGHVDIITGTIMIISAMMISYIRAKGESLGLKKMAVGLMERTERLFFLTILIIIALAVPSFRDYVIYTTGNLITITGFSIGYMVLTLLCVITVFHRFIHSLILIKKESVDDESIDEEKTN